MLFFLLTTLVYVPFSLALVGGSRAVEERDSCPDVHLFLARGNGEAYPGRVGALTDAICGGISSCDSENIMFTSVDGSIYCDSISEGASNGISQITAYNKKCPKTKLVLGGYSEGAQVVGDILGGGGGTFYNCIESSNAPLSPSTTPGNMIAAALIFGDPRHVGGESYNTGSGSGSNGQYPRSGEQLADLNLYSNKLRSWCISSDPICALGDDGESHTTYMTLFASDAGAWAQSILSKPISPVVIQSSSSTVFSSSTSSSAPSSTSTSTVPASTTSATSSSASSSSSGSASASSTSKSSSSSSTTSSSSSSSTITSSSFSSTSAAPTTTFSIPILGTSVSFKSQSLPTTTSTSSKSSSTSIATTSASSTNTTIQPSTTPIATVPNSGSMTQPFSIFMSVISLLAVGALAWI